MYVKIKENTVTIQEEKEWNCNWKAKKKAMN